jgi:hypothetical protein
VAVFGPVAMNIVRWQIYGRASSSWDDHLPWMGLDAAAILMVCGVWLLTSREGYPPADKTDGRLRRWLWWAALPPLLALLIIHASIEIVSRGVFAVSSLSFLYHDDSLVVYWIAFAVGVIGSIPLPLLLFRRLRDLATRARSARLADHCTVVGNGASLALAYVAGCMVLSVKGDDWFGPYWTSRSQVWMGLAAGIGALAVLFVLRCLYLLIRFAAAFGRASWELKRRWMMQDRSIVMAVQ